MATKDLIFINGLCVFLQNGLLWRLVLDLVFQRLMGSLRLLHIWMVVKYNDLRIMIPRLVCLLEFKFSFSCELLCLGFDR